MTAEQFVYWLQGHAELSDGPPSAEQWQAIRDHLQAVFAKVTPLRGFHLDPLGAGGIIVKSGEGHLMC